MSDKIDFSEFTDDVDDTQLLTVIANTAEQLKEAQAKVERITAELGVATHEARVLAERTLPELMLRAKMDSFKTTTGLHIDITETVRATMPKDTKLGALQWLRDHGYGALINTDVKATFSVGKEEDALALYQQIQKMNTPAASALTSDVHHSRFNSWAIKRLEEGVELPSDLFSIYRQRAAKLTEE